MDELKVGLGMPVDRLEALEALVGRKYPEYKERAGCSVCGTLCIIGPLMEVEVLHGRMEIHCYLCAVALEELGWDVDGEINIKALDEVGRKN